MGRQLRRKPEKHSKRLVVLDIVVFLVFSGIILVVIRPWVPAIVGILGRALIVGFLIVAGLVQKGPKD